MPTYLPRFLPRFLPRYPQGFLAPLGRFLSANAFQAGLFTGAGLSLSLAAAVLPAVLWRWRVLHDVLARALHEAAHDRLTGLANRAGVDSRLRSGSVGMAGLLDLDHFKDVNDHFGHDVGDQLLVHVGARLQEALGTQGLVARYGGDEFLLLWEGAPANPLEHARLLLSQALRPLLLEGHLLSPSASLGLAVAGPDLDAGSLVAAADVAMYEAKRTGQVCLYSAADPVSRHRVDRRRHGWHGALAPDRGRSD